eukprot:3762590-Prymnesium_polylepis.1
MAGRRIHPALRDTLPSRIAQHPSICRHASGRPYGIESRKTARCTLCCAAPSAERPFGSIPTEWQVATSLALSPGQSVALELGMAGTHAQHAAQPDAATCGASMSRCGLNLGTGLKLLRGVRGTGVGRAARCGASGLICANAEV